MQAAGLHEKEGTIPSKYRMEILPEHWEAEYMHISGGGDAAKPLNMSISTTFFAWVARMPFPNKPRATGAVSPLIPVYLSGT